MILVVGATGELGGRIVRALAGRGESVRALVRRQDQMDLVRADGAEPVQGDLRDPASLRAACRGAATVITTATSASEGSPEAVQAVDLRGNLDLVDAAEEAGVRRFLFVSPLGAAPDHPDPFMRAKGTVEERLRGSTMDWTVLQCDLFLDRLPMLVVGLPALTGRTVVLVGEGRRRHSLVATADVAAYAIAALADPGAVGRTLVVGGPDAVSWRDVVAAFAEELGREVPVETVLPGHPVAGVPEVVQPLLAALETYDSVLDTAPLARAYGVRPTTLAELVHGTVTGSRPG
ncbi:SDR family oxidoreductase [Georgenia muralis]